MTDADPAAVLDAFRRATGLAPPGLRAERLPLGHGHENWRVDDDDGGRFLVKLADRRRRPQKTENNVAAQRLAASRGVRVPDVVGLDLDGGALGRPFYVQRWVEGTDAEHALPAMSPADRAAFAAAYAAEVAKLHAIPGDAFSMGVLPSLRLVGGWREYVARRLGELRAMNERAGVLGRDVLETVLAECARLAGEIDVGFAPALAHRDLYPRNVVVGGGARVDPRDVTLLDFEHARFTDPAWDFVKLEVWNFLPHPDIAAPFLAAYRAARGPEVAGAAFERRIRLCRGLEYLAAFPYFGVEFPAPALVEEFRGHVAREFL